MKPSQIFDNAYLFKWFQKIVSPKNSSKLIIEEIIRPAGVKKVIDFGCGIGHLANEFESAEYLGIEPLKKCVDLAQKNYRSITANFIVGDHNNLTSIPRETYDLIIAIGVLHHMDNQAVQVFIKQANRILTKGGRLVTFDPVFHQSQSKVSKLIVKQDRGLWVRTPEQYMNQFVNMSVSSLNYKIYSKLLRIPYDHIAITALMAD